MGADYRPGGVCLLSVNPAGGKDDYQATENDCLIYEAAAVLAAADEQTAEAALSNLSSAFIGAMPRWGSQWRHVKAILTALDLPVSAIAYLYLIPFRTRGDKGSRLPLSVIERGAALGMENLLDALAPGLVVAMDEPSSRIAARWSNQDAKKRLFLYYTRKLDAHADRAATLKRLTAIKL